MNIDVARLERDLRAASSAYDDVVVSSDAWQENQLRLGAGRQRRSPVPPVAVAVAAAVVVLLLVGGALLVRGPQHTASGPPAGPAPQTTSPDGSIHLAGGVEALRLKIGTGYAAVDVAAYGGSSSAPARVCSMSTGEGKRGDFFADAPICSGREPRADDPAVAIDYLTAGPPHPNPNTWVSVAGAVDSRVTSVQVWNANGNTGSLPVTRLGSSNLSAFGYVMTGPDHRPQRLVAFGADGRVLQSIDLAQRLGSGWLTLGSGCGELSTATELPSIGTSVAAEPGFAKIDVHWNAATARTVCLPLTETGQGVKVDDGDAVLVVAPEVANVLPRGAGSHTIATQPAGIPDTIWQTVTVHRLGGGFDPAATFDLTDVDGQVLDTISLITLN
jgi:hypothetical protein